MVGRDIGTVICPGAIAKLYVDARLDVRARRRWAELKAMGIRLVIASSLSDTAISHFLEKFSLKDFFSEVWTRDNASGIKVVPLVKAIINASFKPEHVMFLTDTAEGLKVAKEVGVNSILMINDPDEARRLAMDDPAGGIVSLHELPDFIRLIVAENARLPRL